MSINTVHFVIGRVAAETVSKRMSGVRLNQAMIACPCMRTIGTFPPVTVGTNFDEPLTLKEVQ